MIEFQVPSKDGLRTVLLDKNNIALTLSKDWVAYRHGNTYYVKTRGRVFERLHKLVLPCHKGMTIDHIN